MINAPLETITLDATLMLKSGSSLTGRLYSIPWFAMLTLLPQDLARLIIELLTHAEGLCALEATCKALRHTMYANVKINAHRMHVE